MIRPEPRRFIPDQRKLDHLFPDVGDDVSAHRRKLQAYVHKRDGLCWAKDCMASLNVNSMHEPLRRSHAQGWPEPWRVLIFTPYNAINLCYLHHGTPYEPPLIVVADWMLLQYGADYVQWLRSLPFHPEAHPLKGWLAGKDPRF